MPELYADKPIEPLTEAQQHKVYEPEQPWSDDFALKVAVQDFQSAETYRSANHDWRWREHSLLYEAWTQQKYWEGSRIPRSSIPIFLCFEQIESMLPKILSAIFSDNPWFQTEPDPGTTPKEAAEIRNLILMQMDQTKIRSVINDWIKSGLMFGNGIMQLAWIQRVKTRKRYVPTLRQQFATIGSMDRLPQGYQRVLQQKEFTELENRPELRHVLLPDFYIDPNCPTTNPQDARYCYTRALPTVDELDALRDNEEWKIPSKNALIALSYSMPTAQGDITAGSVETARSGWWNRSTDQTVDPGGRRIELLCRWSTDRCVYTMNRQVLAYNETNPYGFMPFYGYAYASILGRFYALGMCDVLEGEQRFRTSLRNARVDEIALNIHRPMIKRRGVTTSPSQMRVKPGQVLEANDPQTDFVFPNPPNVLQSAYVEDQYSQAEAQKITGMTDLVASGMPQAGGNSALRSATGVGAAMSAGSSRIQYLVENAEDMGIEPMLTHVFLLNQLYPPIGGVDVPGPDGGPAEKMGPEVIVNGGVRIRMRGSAKMQSRQALMQTLPLILQTFMNPAFMQQLALQGEAVDVGEFARMVLDMTNYRKFGDLIRKLTPEEQQKMNQPPAEATMKMEMQDKRLASQEKTTTQKLESAGENVDIKTQIELAKAALMAVIKMGEEEKTEPKKK